MRTLTPAPRTAPPPPGILELFFTQVSEGMRALGASFYLLSVAIGTYMATALNIIVATAFPSERQLPSAALARRRPAASGGARPAALAGARRAARAGAPRAAGRRRALAHLWRPRTGCIHPGPRLQAACGSREPSGRAPVCERSRRWPTHAEQTPHCLQTTCGLPTTPSRVTTTTTFSCKCAPGAPCCLSLVRAAALTGPRLPPAPPHPTTRTQQPTHPDPPHGTPRPFTPTPSNAVILALGYAAFLWVTRNFTEKPVANAEKVRMRSNTSQTPVKRGRRFVV